MATKRNAAGNVVNNGEVRYIRNMRPNMFLIKLYPRTPNQITFKLGRRGERTDSIAVPGEAFNDNSFLRSLRMEQIEEISYDTFMALSGRENDWPQEELVERVQHGVSSAFDPEIRIPIGMDIKVGETDEIFRDPVSVKEFNPEWLRPRLEFKEISDSENDADRALAEVKHHEEIKRTPRAKRKPTGDPTKLETINRANSPRKGLIKGVTGGEKVVVMEEDE